jgi:hypothetical protein
MLEAVSMMGGGLLPADEYHTGKACQEVISSRGSIDRRFSALAVRKRLPSLSMLLIVVRKHVGAEISGDFTAAWRGTKSWRCPSEHVAAGETVAFFKVSSLRG